MKGLSFPSAAVLLAMAALGSAGAAIGATHDPARPQTAPPKLVVLVYQRFQADKSAARDRWEIATARGLRQVDVPNAWIVLESLTGRPEVLSFDPFDSFAQIGNALARWGAIFASHPALAKLQAQIDSALASQRTIVAVRRDDLSYRAERIDLSKARFLRVLEVRLHPGHEDEFAEAFRALSSAYEKTDSDLPWVVYQVNLGMPSPAFFAFVPMKELAQNDDLLAQRPRLRDAEGEAAERMQQIARAAYAHTQSDLYVINPAKSHVPKEFAASNPEFWNPSPRPAANSAPRQRPADKPAR